MFIVVYEIGVFRLATNGIGSWVNGLINFLYFDASFGDSLELLFRDYLRKYPGEAKRYFELKGRWSGMSGLDGSEYVELKTQYIGEVLEKARKELGELV